MSEQALGPTDVRRVIPKNSDKISPRAHLELKCAKTSESFITVREQLGPFWGCFPEWTETSSQSLRAHVRRQRSKQHVMDRRWYKKDSLSMGQEVVQNSRNVKENEATFFKPNSKNCSSINLNRQSRRQRVSIVDSDASIPIISKMDLSSKELETVEVSRLLLTVITTDGSIDTTEETAVNLKNWTCSSPSKLLKTLQRYKIWETAKKTGIHTSKKKGQTSSIFEDGKLVPLRLR